MVARRVGWPNQRHHSGLPHGCLRLLILPVIAFGRRSTLGQELQLGDRHLRCDLSIGLRLLRTGRSQEIRGACESGQGGLM